MVASRPRRNLKSLKRRTTLDENIENDSIGKDDEFVVVDDLSDEEFEKPKRKRQWKQTTFACQSKEPILDLEEFYKDQNDKLVIQRNDLKLPPHLNNLIFYPFTPLTFDYHDPSNCSQVDSKKKKIRVDRNWLLIHSDTTLTGKNDKDVELGVRSCSVILKVPRVFSLENGLKFDIQAVKEFTDSDPYFKRTFPTTATNPNSYPKQFLTVINQTRGTINPGMESSMIVERIIEYRLENPEINDRLIVPCPEYMQDIDPDWFRIFCIHDIKVEEKEKVNHPVLTTNYINLRAHIYIYIDCTKLASLKKERLQLIDRSFRDIYSKNFYPHHLQRENILSIRVSSPTAYKLSPLALATLSWMKNVIETDEDNHSVNFVDSSSILRVDALPEKLINLREGVIVDYVSGHFLEKNYSVYGGVITYDYKGKDHFSKTQSRMLFINLIHQAPLKSFSDLQISDFQKHFLLPSKATIIFVASEELKQWHELITEFNSNIGKPLRAVILNHSNSFDQISWEAVLFSDIVLCNREFEKMVLNSVNNSYSRSFPKDFFYQRKGEVYDNIEPSPLLHMKSKIMHLDQLFTRKGSVDLRGVYWHRVIDERLSSHVSSPKVASNWKWISCDEDIGKDVLVRDLLGASLEMFDCVSIICKFSRTLSSKKVELDAPIVVTSDIYASSDIKGPNKGNDSTSRNSKRKGKSVVRDEVSSPIIEEPRVSVGSSSESKNEATSESLTSNPASEVVGSVTHADEVDSPILIHDVINDENDIATLVASSSKFAEEMRQLVNMGFADANKCRDALERYDGDIERAVNFML